MNNKLLVFFGVLPSKFLCSLLTIEDITGLTPVLLGIKASFSAVLLSCKSLVSSMKLKFGSSEAKRLSISTTLLS